jgi:hypothetical protein
MMDFVSFEPLDLEAWASIVDQPSREPECPTTPSSLSFPNLDLTSPIHSAPLWHEQPVSSQDQWPSISANTILEPSLETSLTAISPRQVSCYGTTAGIVDAVSAPSLDHQQVNPSLQSSPKGTKACSCLRNLLLISEHLDQHPVTSVSFVNTLSLFQKAMRVCRRYVQCQEYDESLAEILCVSAFRRVSVGYRSIAVATQSSAFDAVVDRKFRCKTGQFETDVILDLNTLKAVLCSELEQASMVAVEMEKLLGHGTERRRPVDPITRRYHQDLMRNVHKDIQASLSLLKKT